MASERQPQLQLQRVGLFLAISASAMFVVAGLVWGRRPLDGVLNEIAVMVLATTAVIEMVLALWFFRRAGL